jgi:purine-cytosine permease-like protein
MAVYSTAISSLNIAPKLGERPGIILGGLLGTALALVFAMDEYQSFLLWIGATFVPYFGVVLADYFLLHDREIHTRCDDSVARVIDIQKNPVPSRTNAKSTDHFPLYCGGHAGTYLSRFTCRLMHRLFYQVEPS